MKRNKYVGIQLIEMMIGISITAIGLSCMIKSGLGQTSITSFTQNITKITQIKSGTVLTCFFLSCTAIQLLILRKKFKKIQLLQVLVALLQGKIVNLICYDIPAVATYTPPSYFIQWIFVLVGIAFCSYGVAIVFKAELIGNPFEELAMVIANKLQIEFSVFRVRVDMFFMVLSLTMIVVFHLDFTTVREGTWVSMLLLGKSMKYTFSIAEMTSVYYRKTHRLKMKEGGLS